MTDYIPQLAVRQLATYIVNNVLNLHNYSFLSLTNKEFIIQFYDYEGHNHERISIIADRNGAVFNRAAIGISAPVASYHFNPNDPNPESKLHRLLPPATLNEPRQDLYENLITICLRAYLQVMPLDMPLRIVVQTPMQTVLVLPYFEDHHRCLYDNLIFKLKKDNIIFQFNAKTAIMDWSSRSMSPRIIQLNEVETIVNKFIDELLKDYAQDHSTTK